MRQESKLIATAFIKRRSARAARTSTDGRVVYLHGNPIAWWEGDVLCLTLANWPTVTTRERLNAICELVMGKRPFHQSNYDQYYDDEPISERGIIRVEIIPVARAA